jgi:hypothetical protein
MHRDKADAPGWTETGAATDAVTGALGFSIHIHLEDHD